MRRVTILFLIITFTLLLAVSAFTLTKEEQAWKEDILTLLSLVKRLGDYSEAVELIEVAPALKGDPEIRKAFVTFAPPGATPPEWAREEKEAPPVKIEVPEKIAIAEAARKALEEQRAKQKEKERREMKEGEVKDYYRVGKKYYCAADYQKAIGEFEKALKINPLHKKAKKYLIKSYYEMGEKFYRNQAYRQASIEFKEVLALEPGHKKAKEFLSKCQAKVGVEVVKEIPEEKKVEIVKGEPKIEAPREAEIVTEGPPEKIVTAEAQKEKERREREEGIEEELGIIPTPLPKGAKVIYSTDVVSGVKAEMVGGKMRVTIALSGEREYKVSERTRPPSIVINIPHTINAIAPETIPINKGCLRMIKATQHRHLPVAEARITVILNRWTEYRVTHRNNEIYIDFEE